MSILSTTTTRGVEGRAPRESRKSGGEGQIVDDQRGNPGSPRESRKSGGGSEIVDDQQGGLGPPKESRKSGGGSEIVDDQRVPFLSAGGFRVILSAGGGPVPKFKRLKTIDPGTKDNGKRPPVTIEVHFASMKNQDLGVPISAVDRGIFGVCSAQKGRR